MTTPQPREIEGTVKWFDAAKGYGFIVPSDSSMPDIMLHANTLRRSNLEPPVPDGSTIVTEIEEGPGGGLRASNVLSLDTSTGGRTLPQTRTHVVVRPQGEAVKATCKWFNRLRGYGFLTRGPNTEDIFVHMETLKSSDIIDLQPGDEIMVRFGDGPKGLMAAELQPVY